MIMDALNVITEKFVKQSQDILGENLVGIYLHGSAVMGCFNDEKSDRGLCLYGEEIRTVFENVGQKVYLDSIWSDIEGAEEDIVENSVYVTLNLCRALAYKQENLLLSKQEGGKWGLENVPKKYCKLIQQALDAYASVKAMEFDGKEALEYVKYMLARIGA